jgi:hypothetical protein
MDMTYNSFIPILLGMIVAIYFVSARRGWVGLWVGVILYGPQWEGEGEGGREVVFNHVCVRDSEWWICRFFQAL